MRNLIQDIKCISALDAVAYSADTNGLVVDTQGYESLAFTINVGDFTFTDTNKITWKVQQGDLANGSDMADIPAGDYLDARNEAGAAWDRIMDDTGDDEQAYVIGVATNTKRYRRLVATEGGTVSVPLSATAVLGHPRHAPAGLPQQP